MNAEIIGMIISDTSEKVFSTLDIMKDIVPGSDRCYVSSLVPDSIMYLKMEMIAAMIFQGSDDSF